MKSIPIRALSLFILISPIVMSVDLRDNILEIQGAKPLNLLAILVILFSLIFYNQSVKMSKYVFYAILFMFLIFTISIIRSLKYLDLFNQYLFANEKLDTSKYLLSEYVKPIVYFLPIIVIVKFSKTEKDIIYITNVVFNALLLFSVILLYCYIFYIRDLSGDLQINSFYSYNFGLHRNSIGNFFIIAFPISLRKFNTNKKLTNILSLIIIMSAIGITLSRTTYICALLAILMFQVFSRKWNIIPMIFIIALVVSIMMSTVMLERITTGFGKKDLNINEISSSRVSGIWTPLIEDYIKSPMKLIFGNGRYSIISTNAARKGFILENIRHAHNMYLDIILDSGLIGLFVFIAFYYYVLKNLLIILRKETNDNWNTYIQAFIVSIVCYLASGFTGRTFFPRHDNVFIWIVLGCSIASFNIKYNEDKKEI